jgi:hypothetical protein
MAQRELMIQKAIEDLKNGVYPSQKQAAAAYDIPRATLQERLNGRTNARVGHEQQQRLTPPQEDFLVEWILEEDQRGYPPSHARTREMASRILRMNGDSTPLGKRWITKFLQRNPRVASIVGRRIEASRVDSTSQEALLGFFTRFEEAQKQFNVLLENTWNMDEHGIALGVCTNSKVLASSTKKKTYKKSPEDREWVSIVEAMSATGQKIRPLTIFKGKNLQTTWYQHDRIPDWIYTSSANGWTSNRIAYEWLRTVFEPETRLKEGETRILLCDGHGSHIDLDFLYECKLKKIHLIFLPPYSSHVLQPLNVGCFSPLKSSYRT